MNRDIHARDYGATCAGPMVELPGFSGAWLFPGEVNTQDRHDFYTRAYAGRFCSQVTVIDVHDMHESAHAFVRSLSGFRLVEHWADPHGYTWFRYRQARKWTEPR